MIIIKSSSYILNLFAIIEASTTLTHSPLDDVDATTSSLSSSRLIGSCSTGYTFQGHGLCLEKSYQEDDPPNAAQTIVVMEYVSTEIIEIKEEKHRMELIVVMRYVWEDSRIQLISSFTKPIASLRLKGILIPWFLADKMFPDDWEIWHPDGIKMSTYSQAEEIHHPFSFLALATGKSALASYSSMKWPFENPNTTVLIAQTDFRVTLVCDFYQITFPFDAHDCRIRVSNEDVPGLLLALSSLQKPVTDAARTFSKDGFAITRSLDEGLTEENVSYVDLRFHMKRILSPFVFQYHLPSAAIVSVSQISFIIPTSAIPGRIGLLATLFLTLINLFINHMVRVFFE